MNYENSIRNSPATIVMNPDDGKLQAPSPEIIKTSVTDSGLLDSFISAANIVNKLFQKSSCAVCQMYTDKQLEFEIRQDRLLQSENSTDPDRLQLTSSEDSGCCSQSTSPVDRAYMKCASGPSGAFEIAMYRQFLFDEESVVDTIENRTGYQEE